MTDQELAVFHFLVSPWIAGLLAEHARTARPVESFGFSRLPSFFSEGLLGTAKVAIVDKVPIPPLRAMGLSKIAEFENLTPDSISYHDTYFIKRGGETSESLHFHELVHVVQWQALGPERFLKAYAEGLKLIGYRARDYRQGPLELIACDLQSRFDQGESPFDVEAEVMRRVKEIGA